MLSAKDLISTSSGNPSIGAFPLHKASNSEPRFLQRLPPGRSCATITIHQRSLSPLPAHLHKFPTAGGPLKRTSPYHFRDLEISPTSASRTSFPRTTLGCPSVALITKLDLSSGRREATVYGGYGAPRSTRGETPCRCVCALRGVTRGVGGRYSPPAPFVFELCLSNCHPPTPFPPPLVEHETITWPGNGDKIRL